MTGESAFICPFCGAPYRELIPVGVVQVECRYCGATVLVPPRLGGAVQRCPNHPETLAVGLCSECGGNYCDRCLYRQETLAEPGQANAPLKYYICPKCLEEKNARLARGYLRGGASGLVLSLFLFMVGLIFALETVGHGLLVMSFVLFFVSLGVLARGARRKEKPLEKPETLHEEMEARVEMAKMAPDELYELLLDTTELTPRTLRFAIEKYTRQGLTREEAIRRIADLKGVMPPRKRKPV